MAKKLGSGMNKPDYVSESLEKVFCSVADPDPNPGPPDPHVFGPPGSGSTIQRYGS